MPPPASSSRAAVVTTMVTATPGARAGPTSSCASGSQELTRWTAGGDGCVTVRAVLAAAG